MTDSAALLNKHSFVELGARQRAQALLDAGSFRTSGRGAAGR
jgi:malonate decarboxylase beta subunit